jgi:hypothetical protein
MKVRTRLLFHWSEIALEQLANAEGARADLARQHAANEPPEALSTELRASMICVAASAHAIDALYGELTALAEDRDTPLISTQQKAAWKANGTPRHSQIYETLKRAFRLDQQVASELEWLFKRLRDPAIHPRTSFEVPEAHPLGLNVQPLYILFAVESARRAVAVLATILAAAIERPVAAFASWTEELRPIAETVSGQGAGH